MENSTTTLTGGKMTYVLDTNGNTWRVFTTHGLPVIAGIPREKFETWEAENMYPGYICLKIGQGNHPTKALNLPLNIAQRWIKGEIKLKV